MVKVYSAPIDFLENEIDGILISVVQTKGSVPRDSDAFMLVNLKSLYGTVGGGCLEFDAIQKARDLIKDSMFTFFSMEYRLGPKFGQCCGGGVELNFERLIPDLRTKIVAKEHERKRLWDNVLIFGAGHVGQALTKQLEHIPLNVSLIDSRPRAAVDFVLPENCKTTPFPEAEIRNASPGSAYVILTHDHALDFLLVKEALIRNDAAYVGMIGSETKKIVLKKWLHKEGICNFENFFTPLGGSITNTKLSDKRPEIIANLTITEILVAAQLKKDAFKHDSKTEAFIQ